MSDKKETLSKAQLQQSREMGLARLGLSMRDLPPKAQARLEGERFVRKMWVAHTDLDGNIRIGIIFRMRETVPPLYGDNGELLVPERPIPNADVHFVDPDTGDTVESSADLSPHAWTPLTELRIAMYDEIPVRRLTYRDENGAELVHDRLALAGFGYL